VDSKHGFLKTDKSTSVSGLEKPSGLANKKRAFGAIDPARSERSKKHRPIDGLEEDVISCTQHYFPTDLSANDELGFIKEERRLGLLKNFKEQSIRSGVSCLPSMFTTKDFSLLDLTH